MVDLRKGDCLQIMKDIPNKSVDMILCDLPYGKTRNAEDKPLPFEPLWEHYKRIIKDNGAILLFGQGTFYVDLVNSNRKMFRYDIVWDKVLTTGFLNAHKMPLRSHEQIAVFYEKLPTYNPQMTEGKPLHSKGKNYKIKNNNNYGEYNIVEDVRKGSTEKFPKSIITITKPHPSKSKHRTEKPIELLEYLIKTYSNEGDIILDNCMGAGGCGVASVINGRNFIGIEKNPLYFDFAKGRIEKARAENNKPSEVEGK